MSLKLILIYLSKLNLYLVFKMADVKMAEKYFRFCAITATKFTSTISNFILRCNCGEFEDFI